MLLAGAPALLSPAVHLDLSFLPLKNGLISLTAESCQEDLCADPSTNRSHYLEPCLVSAAHTSSVAFPNSLHPLSNLHGQHCCPLHLTDEGT